MNMDGVAEQVQHDMVADQRNYGWNYDAALPSMWLREGCCSDAEERGFTSHACAASVCQGAIIGGLSLCMICVYNPPHLEASGFHLHSPLCRQRRVTERHAGYRSRMCRSEHVLQLLSSPLSWLSFAPRFSSVDVSPLLSPTLHPHCVTVPSFTELVFACFLMVTDAFIFEPTL